ncbi:MAG: alanine--tRNA ligase-related protein [Nocardioides sp.]
MRRAALDAAARRRGPRPGLELLPVSRDKMALGYPELERDWARISAVAYAEEDAFRQTLRAGTQIFDMATAQVKCRRVGALRVTRRSRCNDTYGFRST